MIIYTNKNSFCLSVVGSQMRNKSAVAVEFNCFCFIFILDFYVWKGEDT